MHSYFLGIKEAAVVVFEKLSVFLKKYSHSCKASQNKIDLIIYKYTSPQIGKGY